MLDCSKCKDFSGCPGKEFFEPKEIRFCPAQIIWLLQHIQELYEFSWPSGYEVAIIRRRKPSGGGYFETPADFAYEIERRVLHCGLDGLLAYLYYGFDMNEKLLTRFFHLDGKTMKKRIDAVIQFCSGWNFYQRPYRRDNVLRDKR